MAPPTRPACSVARSTLMTAPTCAVRGASQLRSTRATNRYPRVNPPATRALAALAEVTSKVDAANPHAQPPSPRTAPEIVSAEPNIPNETRRWQSRLRSRAIPPSRAAAVRMELGAQARGKQGESAALNGAGECLDIPNHKTANEAPSLKPMDRITSMAGGTNPARTSTPVHHRSGRV